MKPTIYLDIDGVILANEEYASNYANEFLQYIIANYPVTWLTTHCMDNDPETAVSRLKSLLEPKTVAMLSKIRGSTWSSWKTEAIDFTKPFLWFDDDCYPEEQVVLNQYGVLENWIEIDLYKDVDQLQNYLNGLPEALAPIAPKTEN